MKRVLRSCFDPLPRFMSMKSLVCLVAMVLVGTGISVYEYLESARPLERSTPPAHIYGRARSNGASEFAGPAPRCLGSSPSVGVSRSESSERHSFSFESPACVAEPEANPTRPTIWQPTLDQAGS